LNDWSNCDLDLLALVAPVVEALSPIVADDQIMLVGAQCRDLLHWRFGCGPPPRSTNDTDVAVALRDWDQFVSLREQFPAIGDSGHRFLIGGTVTDVIPFGDVEAPSGTTSHPPGKDVMNVHGFTDAYQRADELPVSEVVRIRIPRAEGYAVLKTHAWLDRSASYDYKDGSDLALAAYWYGQDLDCLYQDTNHWALDLHDYDLYRAAAALLGEAMRNGLSAEEFAALTTRVAGADRDLLAEHFGAGAPSWPRTGSSRRPIVDALFNQLTSGDVH
jgi:predicted nucleotidyltransferase